MKIKLGALVKKNEAMNAVVKHSGRELISVLVISGCMIDYTPVVKSYIRYVQESGCQIEVVEYKKYGRVRFILSAVSRLLTRKYSKIVCANHQSLPIILFLSWVTSKPLIFWKLESYKPFENWSVALNLQLFEYLLRRNSVTLVVPTNHRKKIQSPKYKETYVLPNAPIKPYVGSHPAARKFRPENIKLVLYGSIHKNENVFLDEWVAFCEQVPSCDLTVIGKGGTNTQRVFWCTKLEHGLLINELCDPSKYSFSVVGYRATGQNNLYAAPNKLIESLACGLPVIGHAGNPYVVEMIERFGCGLIVDFALLDSFTLDVTDDAYAHMVCGAIEAANRLCLANSVIDTPMDCC